LLILPSICVPMTRRPPRSTPFPTRRSSDLPLAHVVQQPHALRHGRVEAHLRRHVAGDARDLAGVQQLILPVRSAEAQPPEDLDEDRKSTRLNSSHVKISYAVFCLKKKTRTT